MVALRLFWKGFGHIWDKVKTRVAAGIFPLSSFVRLVLIMVFAVWLGLAIVAVAFGLAWLFLALVTSAEEARSIAILALSTALTSMAGVIALLSGQAVLARFLSRRWGVPFAPTPNPLLATSTLIAFSRLQPAPWSPPSWSCSCAPCAPRRTHSARSRRSALTSSPPTKSFIF